MGPAQADCQTAETAVRSETVVGAGDIAFRRCRTGSNGLLDDRPIQSRGLPKKEDRIPANEHIPISLDEVISEIATILARGYMRHLHLPRKSGHRREHDKVEKRRKKNGCQKIRSGVQ
ncbi:MAG: hypothetical protein DYH02_16735, partial [Candidatus Omnitrophica bacterium COP1]|nr:hypothetical protein [Candidatus Omnitrophica bacterium COP1]